MALDPCLPHGRRLLPNLIDHIAATNPTRIFASIPSSPDLSQGYRDVTFREFAACINNLAWLLEEKIGRSSAFETTCYIGLADMRYQCIMIALVKLGYQCLFVSHTNSVENALSLLNGASCKILLQSGGAPLMDEVSRGLEVMPIVIPELDALLDQPNRRLFPYEKLFDDAKHEPLVVLHTSGTTGVPKPITITHDYAARVDMIYHLPSWDGRKTCFQHLRQYGRRMYVGFMPFHVGGLLLASIFVSVFGEGIAVFGPANSAPDSTIVKNVLKHGQLTSAILSPMILTNLSKDAESLDLLSTLTDVVYAGGQIPPDVGAKVSKACYLFGMLGSTEAPAGFSYMTDPEDWRYLLYSPTEAGTTFERVPGSDLFEMVYVRTPESEPYHAVWTTFPEYTRFRSKDLLRKHPSKPNLWIHVSRTDDMLVFSTGLKFLPASYEQSVSESEFVCSVLMFGNQKSQAGLLVQASQGYVHIETPEGKDHSTQLLARLWPHIEELNNVTQRHARVDRNMIIFTNPDKPMLLTAKGTVQRNATLEAYQAEIEALYD